MKEAEYVRLDTAVKTTFSPQAKLSYECQKYLFKEQNVDDEHYHLAEDREIGGLFKDCLVIAKEDEAPWFMRESVFWIMNCLLVGWVQRIALHKKTKRVEFKFTKYVVQ